MHDVNCDFWRRPITYPCAIKALRGPQRMRFARSTFVAAGISLVFVGALLCSCAIDMHHGPEVTEAQANSFTVGTSTLDQVVAALGKPSFSGVRPNGEKYAGYGRLHTRVKPPSLATVTGIEPKSEVVGMETTVFFFDPASKLARVERSAEKPTVESNK